jgi:hypothetical protein
MPGWDEVALNRARPLYRGYERGPGAASISYAAMRILETNGSQSEPTVEMQDGSLSYRR